MEVKCVCVRVCLCVTIYVCVNAIQVKEGVLTEVAYCKKAHNFQMDLQTCTRFSEKGGYEPTNG